MTKRQLRALISECIKSIIESDDFLHQHEDFFDRRDEALLDIANSFKAGAKRVYWPKLKADIVAKIWLEYGKRGSIFNEEGMNKIADQMVTLVARFTVTTELSGHTQSDPREELLSNYEIEFTDDEWDKFLSEFLTDEHGRDLLSDYGLKPLQSLAIKLLKANGVEEKLQIVDRMLNVVHQRNDLAAIFIEGGTKTLTKIANQGGYTTEFEDFKDQVRQQRSY